MEAACGWTTAGYEQLVTINATYLASHTAPSTRIYQQQTEEQQRHSRSAEGAKRTLRTATVTLTTTATTSTTITIQAIQAGEDLSARSVSGLQTCPPPMQYRPAKHAHFFRSNAAC
jgi:hypothetical protein